MLIEKKEGKVIYKKRSSFFTYGWIDPDSKYFVLLSNLHMSETNPHIALFSIQGKLLFKKKFWSPEIVLGFDEYISFKEKYPHFSERLLKIDAISASCDLKTIYINSFLYTEDETINNFLVEKSKRNHLSECFRVGSNSLFIWFNQKLFAIKRRGKADMIYDPDIILKKNESGNVIGISLLDPCKKRFIIPITKKNKDGIHVPAK